MSQAKIVETGKELDAVVPQRKNQEPRERHSRAFSFVSVLFLLTLLGAGVMAYLWYNQKADVDQLNNEVATAKSAQTSLQSQIDKLKKQNANLGNAVVDQVANGDAATSDKDQIIAVALAYAKAGKDAAQSKYTITVTKQTSTFAAVSVGASEGGGYKCWLKKSNDIWLVLLCGQNTPAQTDIDRWGLPADMV
ncbi:MAG: hypothetical protein WBB39_04770 [Candidatus Saccharimonadales bacterium]